MTATSETLVTPDETAPPVPTGRKRKLLPLIAFLVVVILGLGLWLAYRPVPDQLQGMVEARELRITSKVSARITAFHVEEGQPVKTGQLLYTLDSPEVEARSEQAGGALAAA
ncbi:MAG: biotin/lipoyl-binding protein, partial [Alphaproteobacteria bacterium]